MLLRLLPNKYNSYKHRLPSMNTPITVVGRFPPPLDGQTIATKRLISLLPPALDVHRFNLSAGPTSFTESNVRFRPQKAWHYLTTYPRLRRRLAKHRDTTVLWTSISPSTLGHLRDLLTTLPAFKAAQTVFAVVHWGNFNRLFSSPITRFTARRLVSRLDGFVFLTHELSSRCASWIPAAKRFVVPNTIDEAVYCSNAEVEQKQTDRLKNNDLRLLFISNMTPSKGYMDVLQAVGLLRDRGLDVYADFVGRWEQDRDQKTFEAAVRKHRLQSRITHHGPIADREKIKALYLQADLFLLPTYYPTEAQPLTILEALNAGTPVIVTKHAGIPEMVNDGQNAQFVPPRQPKHIANTAELLSVPNRWLQYSKAARYRFTNKYSPSAVSKRWLELLEQHKTQPTSLSSPN